MFTYAMLFWVGLKLDAPVWYWVLLGISFLLKIFDFGIKMYKAGAKDE